jgi:hypothetical protein
MSTKKRYSHAVTDPVVDCRKLPVITSLARIKNERWVTLAEAREYMGCKGDSAVRTQIRKGRLRAVRFAGGLLVKLVDVHKYVRNRNKGVLRGGGRPRKND